MKKPISQNSHLNLTKASYTINELITLLSIGRSTLNEAIRTGELKSKTLGKRKRLILVTAVIEYLEGMDG